MPPTLSEVLSVVECTRDDFNNWKRREILGTRLPNSRSGVAQEISRKTALEMAFLSALISGGFDTATASIQTAKWLREEATGKLTPAWAGNPRNKQSIEFGGFDKQTCEGLAAALADQIEAGYVGAEKTGEFMPATMLVVIDRAAIVRRVDRLYSEQRS
ncbi:MAG: hypothetical protein KIT82_16160 [Bradyrhizobium sp.]|nr:hypothetical protein [Bradyrhizobium sp.]